jgi:hypothetical protein
MNRCAAALKEQMAGEKKLSETIPVNQGQKECTFGVWQEAKKKLSLCFVVFTNQFAFVWCLLIYPIY